MISSAAAPHDPSVWGHQNSVVTILGTGLGAAYAAWAVHTAVPAARIEIFGPKPILAAGAVWARTNPSPYDLPLQDIGVSLRGKADTYALKQWGTLDQTTGHKLLSNGLLIERGFDPTLFMRKTFLRFPPQLANFRDQSQINDLARTRAAVIQTFSLDFKSSQALVRIPVVVTELPVSERSMYCCYNGIEGDPVVRESFLFGRWFHELPYNASPAVIQAVQKTASEQGTPQLAYPLDIPPWCEIAPLNWEQRHLASNLLLVGRYPQFDRSHLAHQAFDDVVKFMRELFYGG